MKNRIFKIFLITAAMLPVGTNAFFSEVPAERLERKISVDVLTSDDVQVTISQKFKNPTEEILHGRFWFPFPENAREIQFFVDAAGESFDTIRGQERLGAIFDVAEWHRSARFFRLGTDEFSQLGRSSILSISSGETREFKLIFKMSATQIQDFWSLEIFADDDISDTKTEISVAIASESEIPHFFTNLPAGNALTDRSEFGTIFLSQTAGQPLFENLRIWWSKKSIPELSADGVAGKYIGHFFPRPDSAPIENVTILIDRSGSMSGEVWFRVREFVQFLFDHLGDKNFRVVFFDTEPEFFDPDFSEPTTEWQQKVLTKISNTAPVGSADSEKVFSEIFNSETPLPAHHATILISDSISGDFWKKMASDTRLILFSFQKESSPDGPLWAHRSGGFFQKLFRSATQLVESTEILQKWNHLRETIFQNAVTPLENEIEILPEKISAFSDERSPFFVGRILDPTPKFTFRPGTEFLSRAWAGRRIAQILSTEVFSEKNLDAVLSIGRMFGVETSVFGAETARDALRKNLEIVFSTPEFQLELENLAQSGGENLSVGTRFFWSVPLHPTTDGVWRSVDFFDRVDPARIVSIAPFSAAQRALWLEFPEIFADVFGVANQVEFCTHFRCFSLRYGQRAEPSPADRAFLRDFDPNHWANSYVIELVRRDILSPEPNGKLHLERSVDRGEFLKMLFLLRNENFTAEKNSQNFNDVEPDSEFFLPIEFYADNGVVRGFPDGSFRPKQALTRAEAIKILLAADGFFPTEKLEIAIFDDALGWELPWVNEAVRRKIISGAADGKFQPNRELTRAEAAKILVEWERGRTKQPPRPLVRGNAGKVLKSSEFRVQS